MNEIKITPFPDEKATFCGIAVAEPCHICGKQSKEDMHIIRDEDGMRIILCGNCMLKFYEGLGRYLHTKTQIGSEVWKLIFIDGKWDILHMTIKDVSVFGKMKMTGCKRYVWNIYAETKNGDHRIYESFYEMGKTVFFTEKDAQNALSAKVYGKNNLVEIDTRKEK